MNGLPFKQIWLADFEFNAPPGECPDPVCMVARELRTGTTIRLWKNELQGRRLPPFSTGADTLYVSYYASAEMGCHLSLGWPLPARVLDLYTEFRAVTNGRRTVCGNGLLGALAWHRLPSMEHDEKESMRNMVMRGGPWNDAERKAILEYCESDVIALEKLLPVMLPRIDLPRALLRGRYMCAVAQMERVGVPIDIETHAHLTANWDNIKGGLVAKIDARYGIYDGLTFKRDRFEKWLVASGIPWPKLPTGNLALDDDSFRQMSKIYPALAPLRELRSSLSGMRLNDLSIGSDGRNRTLLSPFRAKTGRNQPSTSKFIFGPSVWLRGLIQAPPGRALAYVDWSQQEFGIAAALSGDEAMMDAYLSGDPYLSFAKLARAVPADATKDTHASERELYKTCALGVQFGMGADSLAQRINRPVEAARALLRDHRSTFKTFWEWSDGAAATFAVHGKLKTVFGWPLQNETGDRERTARNFPMQANGAEMMRLAACNMTESGIAVCAPVHDAFLIEAATTNIDEVVALAKACMARASQDVLDGFELRTDVKICRHPARFADPRGTEMWAEVMEQLSRLPAPKSNIRNGCATTPELRAPAPQLGAAAHDCSSYLFISITS